MRQNVAILGASGKVGRTLLGQIADHDVPELGRHVNPTSVVALVNSSGLVVREGGFPAEVLRQIAARREALGELIGKENPGSKPGDLLDTMQRLGYDGDLVVVDATADPKMADLHLRILRETRNRVVTANKNPLSLGNVDLYHQLTQDPTRYKYSATAMAGLGAIPWISERAEIGDKIHTINASLSGTLGFIADQLTKGVLLSEAIRQAQKWGFTEPDFRDDLSGLDVVRKLIILGREAGLTIGIDDIKVERFLPDEYFDSGGTPEECLEAIAREYDAKMARRYAEASARGNTCGNTLRYLASLNAKGPKPELEVGFAEVSQNSAFGRLAGTDNRIEVVTGIYGINGPFKLEGPGAGLVHTASVLRRDLLTLQDSVSRVESNQ